MPRATAAQGSATSAPSRRRPSRGTRSRPRRRSTCRRWGPSGCARPGTDDRTMTRASMPQPSPLDGLNDLVHALRSSRRFIDVLEIAAVQALAALGADGLSLSEWDRDLGRLVTKVNVGVLAPGEVRFPQDEIYQLAREAINLLEGTGFLVQADDPDAPEPDRTILLAAGMASGITMPIHSEGRLWGEMWVTRGAEHAAN